jgi:hypothetical protein
VPEPLPGPICRPQQQPGDEEREHRERELEQQADPERRLEHHPPRERCAGQPPFQEFLEREAQHRQQRERPRRHGALEIAPEAAREHPSGRNQVESAGHPQQHRHVAVSADHVAVPGGEQLDEPDVRVRVDEPIREYVRHLRARDHQRERQQPRGGAARAHGRH